MRSGTCNFLYTLLCSRCGLLTSNLNRSTEVVFIFCVVAKINFKNKNKIKNSKL